MNSNLYLFLYFFFYSGGSTDLSDIRTSKNTWIEDGANHLVDKISLRINQFTGLQTTRMYDEFDEGKKDEYESLQVRIMTSK